MQCYIRPPRCNFGKCSPFVIYWPSLVLLSDYRNDPLSITRQKQLRISHIAKIVRSKKTGNFEEKWFKKQKIAAIGFQKYRACTLSRTFSKDAKATPRSPEN